MAEYHGNESPQDGLAELSSPPADQAADREHQPEVSTARDTADEFDTLVALLRQPAPLASFSQEPGCDRAVEAIRQMGHTPNPSDFAPMASADGQSQPLQTLGQYQLLEKLGEGGMGAVYRAVHTRLEKVVAVKVMSPGRVADTDAVARFSREMKAVGKLNHPNIVGAFDAGEIDGSHYLVMELVDGQDLGAIVRGTGPLPVADACEAVRRAAAGLDHAHAHGLVHRDVKPSNLMLTRQGEIKLLDLGLARLAEQIPGGVELTSTGQMMGTFEYMAPEQGSDSHAVDHRADVYALGATLYKLLAGRAPFAGPQYDTPMKRMMALATEDPEPIRQIRPDVPKDLARVIHRMLARDPGQRTATAREAAERLAPFAAGADLAGLVARADEAAPQPSVEPGTASTQPAASSAMEHTPHTIRISPPAAFRPRAGRLRRVGAWFGNLPPIGRFGLAAAAGAAALILLAVLLTVKTPQGTLVIESDDPSVEVLVKQNGEVIDILSADHGWKVGLKDGKYEVELAGGADRMQLSDNQVTLTRSGRTVLRVTRDVVAADLSVEPTAAPFPAEGTAEDQKAWVVAELKRLNPESTANIGFSVGGNNVTGMKIDDGNIHDLRPLAELTSLQKLECSFGGDDLSPLAGLPLETIFLRGAKITDISPLENAPLKSVNLQYTNVQDLTPLAGKPLEFLDVYGKQRDFSVLKGMPLKNLNIGSTGLKDLTLLEGMPLETLCILGTPVDDLSPLRGMKLRELLCHSTRVRDLGPLEGMPLESLDMRGLKVTDLSPLRGTALSRLDMENALVSDLSPLAATPLRNLNCRGTAVKDFTPLVDTPLLSITCDFRPEDAPVLRRIRTLNTINNRPAGEVLRDAEDKLRNLEDNETPTEPAQPFPEQGSVDEQKAWVVAELKRLNAGFDGKARFEVEGTRITAFNETDAGALRDIRPLSRLESLRNLTLIRTGVHDLSPLMNLKLITVDLEGSPISDLSPLLGMPLETLTVRETKIPDLKGLEGLSLRSFNCQGCGISNLSPLEGMELESLNCGHNPINDISVLSKMPLKNLILVGTMVDDLTPLVHLALESLEIHDTRVTELAPLRGVPLRSITCDFRPEDAPVLRRIRTLNTINNRPAAEVLRDAEEKLKDGAGAEAQPFPEQGSVDEQKAWVVAELKRLNAGFQGDPRFGVEEGKIVSFSLGDQWKLVDISPLKDLPLKRYDCWNNGVSDLSPLRGMPLEFINTSGTQVHDLTPLAGMQLKVLQITDTKVVDLSPLAETTVEEIKCNFVPERDGEGLRQITTLKTINSRPAAEVLRAAEEKLKDSEDSETPDVVEPGK